MTRIRNTLDEQSHGQGIIKETKLSVPESICLSSVVVRKNKVCLCVLICAIMGVTPQHEIQEDSVNDYPRHLQHEDKAQPVSALQARAHMSKPGVAEQS